MKLPVKTLGLAFVMLVSANSFAQRATVQPTPFPASFNMIPTHLNGNLFSSSESEAAKKRKKKRGHDQAWDQGKAVITVGYGFPNVIKRVFKAYESELDYKVSGFGPAYVKFDYGISEKIGLGLSIRYLNYKVQWTDVVQETTYDTLGNPTGTVNKNYTSGYKGSSLGIMARLTVHFATGAKLDPYWGVGLGYGNYAFKYFTDDPNSANLSIKFPIPLAFESTIGVRYFFTDNIGAYAETGLGGSYVQLGLAAKF